MAASTLTRRAALALATAGLGLGAAVVARGGPTLRAPAPFCALAAGHVGKPYVDHVRDAFEAAVTGYKVVDGQLPAGLVLDAATGDVKGTPAEAKVARLRIAGKAANGAQLETRASIAVFSVAETEVKAGQSFEAKGPFATSMRNTTLRWKSSFDGKTYDSKVLIYAPASGTGKLPVLVHHRGRGFGHDDYDDFLGRIASWGVVCASVSDDQSFYSPRNPNAADSTYDGWRAELGMLNASAAQEATIDHVLGLAATPGDALAGRVEPENVFVSGHSRGGGATHASHTRAVPLRARGVIYFMAYDLRNFSACTPPGQPPVYGIPTAQHRLPSLIISAENDGDLTYPIADELIDRATGPTTQVTVYGGVHNYLGDTNSSDGSAKISRADEQKRVASFCVAFIRRWAQDDVSLEGLLYGREAATSRYVGVASWRRASPQLLVDDFQDQNAATNKAGGENAVVALRRSEASVYPASGSLDNLGLKHTLVTLKSQNAAFRLGLGTAGRDVRPYRSVIARVLQTAGDGWRVGLWVQLRDKAGQTGAVKVSREDGLTAGYLPAATGWPYARFINLEVPLAALQASNPGLNLATVDQVSFVFSQQSGKRQVAFDDVRFE